MKTWIPEMEALKTKPKATWMAGDYGVFGKYLEPGALEFFTRLEITPDARVLDVGCGAGQLALPAARAGAVVTGVDIATNLIEQARARAEAEGLAIRFDEGTPSSYPTTMRLSMGLRRSETWSPAMHRTEG